MKIENKPTAWGALAGLLVFLAGLLVWDTGCAHASKLDVNPVQQSYDASVQITTTCVDADGKKSGWYGSGVVVAQNRVFTAPHIAEAHGLSCSYTVTGSDGEDRMMWPVAAIHDLDLASLVLLPDQKPFAVPPAQFGPKPVLGDIVCEAPSFPRRMHRCGEVQPYVNPPGDILWTIIVEPGNSGSGVYDAEGRLVGITTHLMVCEGAGLPQVCGGRGASLEGHVSELLGR